eukprot:Protomagalhaensia_sp_Gyna_25__1896@NODE_2001_length_1354_cov_7_051711_g1649_i0_p4_GENE_NODE_2001_length_1354_cov_7_051711_g1649_i0NODE_2001_length_1354_cov_7_051711_g1649_i0_p4_ORF_typecomplete_len116_score14_40_NODE_2001_length_1354_cov_7_051711_g1649_i0463810
MVGPMTRMVMGGGSGDADTTGAGGIDSSRRSTLGSNTAVIFLSGESRFFPGSPRLASFPFASRSCIGSAGGAVMEMMGGGSVGTGASMASFITASGTLSGSRLVSGFPNLTLPEV